MQIKQYLIEPSILASPEVVDTLYLYLAVSDVSVSVALFKEDENWKQRPVFFVRKSLSEAETQYTRLEQVALALRVVTIVMKNIPLRSTIHKPNLLGPIELSEFGI